MAWVVALVSTGCAGNRGATARAAPAAAEEPASGRSVLTREEILRQGGALTLHDAVRQLRPEWLLSRGVGRRTGGVRVYRDGQDIGGEFALEGLRGEDVVSLRFVSALDAAVRYGLLEAVGVIEVITAAAQAPIEPGEPPPKSLCLRPVRNTSCPGYWITDLGYYLRSDDGRVSGGHSGYAIAEWGAMATVGPRALGASLFYGGHWRGRRWGIKPRLRHWIGDRWALDVMPGVILGGRDDRSAVSFPGWTGQVALEYAGFAGLLGGVDRVGRQSGPPVVDWYVGARSSGEVGAVLGFVTILGLWFISQR